MATTLPERERTRTRPRVGLDYRPAMMATTGIGRYARELAAALTQLLDLG